MYITHISGSNGVFRRKNLLICLNPLFSVVFSRLADFLEKNATQTLYHFPTMIGSHPTTIGSPHNHLIISPHLRPFPGWVQMGIFSSVFSRDIFLFVKSYRDLKVFFFGGGGSYNSTPGSLGVK